MIFPMDAALRVARANFRLGVGLMDVAGKSTQRLLEIGNKEAAGIGEQGRLQDIAGDLGELQMSTAAETRTLIDNWWRNLSGAVVSPISETTGESLGAMFRFWDRASVAPHGRKPGDAPTRAAVDR